ncbi:uncharacterized protein LOC111309517 [Durio zibethinus]|uniref:Uncharacterized protein LOC111309517 n=1 Tax=Durio zibethinus TaxID=66656 RepID=A0A6P6AHL2_DURZI|nr:uncharacterized protein LOC111309517 [Durio zibethinus]
MSSEELIIEDKQPEQLDYVLLRMQLLLISNKKTAASNSKVSLKLLIDSRSNKVLFAEAGKDFVDFLFALLSLPLGTVVRPLTTNNMVGSLGNLYESIESLSETYMQPNQNKDSLMKPRAPTSASDVPLLLLDDDKPVTRKVYMCPNYHLNVVHDQRLVCPQCKKRISIEVPIVSPDDANGESTGKEGSVKGAVTYMVMDDLAVKPMSTISSITLLNKFNVKEVGALEERAVDLGMDDVASSGLKLLRSSLQSKSVLTNVFLGNMRA